MCFRSLEVQCTHYRRITRNSAYRSTFETQCTNQVKRNRNIESVQ